MATSGWIVCAALLLLSAGLNVLAMIQSDGATAAELGPLGLDDAPVVTHVTAPVGRKLCIVESSRTVLKYRECGVDMEAVTLLQTGVSTQADEESGHDSGHTALDTATPLGTPKSTAQLLMKVRHAVHQAVKRGISKVDDSQKPSKDQKTQVNNGDSEVRGDIAQLDKTAQESASRAAEHVEQIAQKEKAGARREVRDIHAKAKALEKERDNVIANTKVEMRHLVQKGEAEGEKLAKQAQSRMAASLQSLTQARSRQAEVLSAAKAKAISIGKAALRKQEKLDDGELKAESKEADTARHKVDQIVAREQETAQELNTKPGKETVEVVSSDFESVVHSPYGGTNTIVASQDRFLCLSASRNSIKYTECHKHASCDTSSGRAHCKCLEGYVGNGHTCNRARCRVLTPPPNGIIQCPQGTMMGSVCKVSCNYGYKLRGPESKKCLGSGRWSQHLSPQHCEEIQCTTPPNLSVDVLKKCTGNSYGDVCELSCPAGYGIHGNTQLVCEAGTALHGEWRGKHESETKCHPVTCGDPPSPPGASVKCTGHGTSKVCTIQCKQGFKQVGSSTHSCGVDGKWHGNVVKCLALKCPEIPAPINGHMKCSGTSVGDSCSSACGGKFKLFGSSIRKCVLTGTQSGQDVTAQWSGIPSRCEEIRCGVIQPIKFGTHTCTGDRVGSVCTFSCEQGHNILGSKQIECRSDGTWSKQDVKCSASNCGQLHQPKSGKAVCTGNRFGDHCKFLCDEGWSLFGSGVRKCLADGTWSGQTSRCGKMHCEPLPAVLNGHQVCSGLVVGDSCYVKCNPGYKLQGNKTRTCTSSGSFDGKLSTCAPVVCPRLKIPKHGTARCNGFRYRHTCKFECDSGYESIGQNLRRSCGEDGKWSGEDIKCKPRSCGMLQTPADGIKHCEGTSFGSACKFSCKPGFQVNKHGAQRKCSASGEWTGELSVCEPVDCGQPKGEGARIRCAHGTKVGNSCQVRCKPGYHLKQEVSTVMCLAHGNWSADVNCAPIRCNKPKTPDHGQLQCAGDSLGQQCSASCDKGFNLVGSAVRTCGESGTFSGKPASCEAVQCAALQKPAGGALSCVEGDFGERVRPKKNPRYNLLGTVCNVSCAEGFNMEGSHRRECQSSGSWSGSPAVCTPNDCGKPAHVEGCVWNCPNGTTVGKHCEMQPMAGRTLVPVKGYTDVDSSHTCQHNGRWTEVKAACKPKQCNHTLPTVADGDVVCSHGSDVGSLCHVQCAANKVRTGDKARECRTDLGWTPGNMTCADVPVRARSLSASGKQSPAFLYASKTGSVSVRLEGDGAGTQTRLNLMAGQAEWSIGVLDDSGFSICHGSVCTLRFDADGAVHFLGSVNFHHDVEAISDVNDASPEARKVLPKDPLSKRSTHKLRAAIGFDLGGPQRAEGLRHPEEELALEEADDDSERVVSLVELDEGLQTDDLTSQTTTISGGAQWASSGGAVGIRLDSQNTLEGKDAYFEFGSADDNQAWTLGVRGDYGLHFGHGRYGKISDTESMVVHHNRVEVSSDAIFYKSPKYYRQNGNQLTLEEEQISNPQYQPHKINKNQTTPADGNITSIVDVTTASLIATDSAEPIVIYKSKDVNLQLVSDTEVYCEMRNKMQNSWRLIVREDKKLHFLYRGHGSMAVDNSAMVMHPDGSIHFHERVLFRGSVVRKV